MKKKILIIVLTLAIGILAGCNDSFFDINDNPNAPTDVAVTPNLLLTTVLNNTAKKMAIDYDFLGHWMGYWARGADYGQSIPLENYDLTNNYEINHWVNGNTTVANPAISWYDILQDARAMEKKAKVTNEPFYVAAAKVIRSIGFMYLVDLYNNVPYSQALDIEKYLALAYDKGQDIYDDLLVQLDSAAILMKQNPTTSLQEQTADIMFGGDTEMWRKLINSQRLKLLIHESEVLGGAPTEVISKITADGAGFLGTGETAEVNPGYALNKYQLNPYYFAFRKDENNNVVNRFDRANQYAIDKYRNNGDVRYKYFFGQADVPLTQDDAGYYKGGSVGRIYPYELVTKSAHQSNVAGPGLIKDPIQAQWLFTSVESMFLQAEAKQRGWLTGSAETTYNEAVAESFKWLEVTDAGTVAENYLAGSFASWSSNTDKINLIVMQKYLALCGINNFEAWVDYRRLGVPSDVPLSLNIGVAGRHIPNRLLYPQNEYQYNSTNVNAEGTIDAQTSRIFWDPN